MGASGLTSRKCPDPLGWEYPRGFVRGVALPACGVVQAGLAEDGGGQGG